MKDLMILFGIIVVVVGGLDLLTIAARKYKK